MLEDEAAVVATRNVHVVELDAAANQVAVGQNFFRLNFTSADTAIFYHEINLLQLTSKILLVRKVIVILSLTDMVKSENMFLISSLSSAQLFFGLSDGSPASE